MQSSQKKKAYVRPTLTEKGRLERVVAMAVSPPPSKAPSE
jgi:hypothetical protein